MDPDQQAPFLGVAAAMAACASLPGPGSGPSSSKVRRFRTVVFDGLALFDTFPIDPAERLFPERGRELACLWRAKSLEYQWRSALSRQTVDFWQ
ncbi:MAG TPA: hypothetical protein VFP65_02535 [Anaeromyxobacteraceae bacterium]|nr:hypothetical protein [Anaeromyxobacteraceae bacterium]